MKRLFTKAGIAATIAMSAAALFTGSQLATASPASPPDVPGQIAVPAGNVLSAVAAAEGFQIYTCQPQGSSYAWLLSQPQAVLVEKGHKPWALHYGGPSWTAMDGSTVTATRVDGAPAPSSSDIPWLLLKAASNTGPDGGTFKSTTFIQRLNTSGGQAPATGCDADHVGSTARIYYTADYYFYRAG